MKTIEERWHDFRRRVIHADAPEIQVTEMRIAFYAGFQAMLDATITISLLENELLGMVELEKLHIEARRFGDLLYQTLGDVQ
jgi:hypothetical protein